MSAHYSDDLRAGAASQLHPNIENGGIIIFDCDSKIAQCEDIGESHQLHIARALSDGEIAIIEWLHGSIGAGGYENESADNRADGPGIIWLNLGPINPALRAYLFSLKA